MIQKNCNKLEFKKEKDEQTHTVNSYFTVE